MAIVRSIDESEVHRSADVDPSKSLDHREVRCGTK